LKTQRERLTAAVGTNLLRADKITYREGDAAFTAETDDSRAVAALVVVIDHR
jgi:hypothetical protein